MEIFRYRKETDKETINRLLKLTDGKDYGMDAQVALIELAHHLLEEDWYPVNPISQEQINTEIVYEIERKYVKRVPSYRH